MKEILLFGYDLHTHSDVGWVLFGFAVAVVIVIVMSFFQKEKE
jgi:disulfide bond formation protein DsbB